MFCQFSYFNLRPRMRQKTSTVCRCKTNKSMQNVKLFLAQVFNLSFQFFTADITVSWNLFTTLLNYNLNLYSMPMLAGACVQQYCISGTKAKHIPLHLLHPWQARFLGVEWTLVWWWWWHIGGASNSRAQRIQVWILPLSQWTWGPLGLMHLLLLLL